MVRRMAAEKVLEKVAEVETEPQNVDIQKKGGEKICQAL